jgi:DNA-binding LacI/PurR family transcriptional regulator
VGYDNTSASQLPGVDLTTVDLHPVDLGFKATEMAIRRSTTPTLEPMLEVFKPSLIVRASSAPPPSA